MTDEIRVTVVATGLGQAVGFAEKPMKVVRTVPPPCGEAAARAELQRAREARGTRASARSATASRATRASRTCSIFRRSCAGRRTERRPRRHGLGSLPPRNAAMVGSSAASRQAAGDGRRDDRELERRGTRSNGFRSDGGVRQRTLKESIRSTGIGLHSGEKVYMTLRPAPANSGIVFRRLDLPEPVDIPATALNVTETMLGTTLEHATCEGRHRRASAVGAWRASASTTRSSTSRQPRCRSWTAAPRRSCSCCESAGIEEQSAPKRFVRVLQARRGRRGRQVGAARPARRLSRERRDRLRSPGAAQAPPGDDAWTSRRASFLKEISRARTFGFLKDLETSRALRRARSAAASTTRS